MFRPFTTVNFVFIKVSIIAISHRFIHIANSIDLDQIDRIGSVGSVSTLIESVHSNEWQCLKIKLTCTKQSRF